MVSEYNAALRQLQDSKPLSEANNPRAKYWPIDALFDKIRRSSSNCMKRKKNISQKFFGG